MVTTLNCTRHVNCMISMYRFFSLCVFTVRYIYQKYISDSGKCLKNLEIYFLHLLVLHIKILLSMSPCQYFYSLAGISVASGGILFLPPLVYWAINCVNALMCPYLDSSKFLTLDSSTIDYFKEKTFYVLHFKFLCFLFLMYVYMYGNQRTVCAGWFSISNT